VSTSWERSLLERYRGLVCDLDGVVYRGPVAVPYAIEALNSAGVPVVYATNNASRTPEEVAQHLVELGLDVSASAVVNSSMAGAAEVARRVPAGSPVLAVGGAGVGIALREAGLEPVTEASGGVVAVLQGYGPDVRAADLAEAAYAIEGGAVWVATNDDRTLPTDRGVAPGNGALVAAVALATGTSPVVVGKPHPPLYLMAGRMLGIEPGDLLAVGDRLETDVKGATAAGMDSVLVLTGVHGLVDAALAPAERRPRFVIADLHALPHPYAEPVAHADGFTCRGATARVEGAELLVTIAEEGGDPLDAARAALASIWEAADRGIPAEDLRVLARQVPSAG
jgi:glycerol 3-phosphatase-2